MEKIYIAVIFSIILDLYIIFNCLDVKKHFKTYEQKSCHHDWRDIHYDSKYIIYCPKCKLEKRITPLEWLEMQIDKEYEEKNK